MTKKLTKIFIVFSAFFVAPLLALAETTAPQGLNLGLQNVTGTGLGSQDLRVTVGNIIYVVLGVLGVFMLVIIIYAGFLYLTSGGNEEKAGSAKKWIFGAVIGLAIILCSYAITSFVVGQLINATAGTNGSEPQYNQDIIGQHT